MLERTRCAFVVRWLALVALAVPAGMVRGQEGVESIIPRPARAESRDGAFVLRNPVRIVVTPGSPRLREVGALLAQAIRERTGFTVSVGAGNVDRAPDGFITLDTANVARDAAPVGGIASEAYTLDVTPQRIAIRGASPAAVLWGVQSLRQLLPPDFDNVRGIRAPSWSIAAVHLEDAPRFQWRGSMVDVARHFFPVAEIKRHIDLLSRYKLNVFHWHLTDDQGWRLEVPAFQLLARFGGRRREASGDLYDGFYTQADVRAVVAYARERGVMVVPEIEMPGHSSAAIAAYPQLGCTGYPLVVPATWGVFADVFCPGKEDTFRILSVVLDDVMALFPSPYIHIGGDEVPKDRWRECASCQAVMRRERLANEEELQGWFLRRIAAHVASRGKTVIGWDEVLDGGFVPGGIVQSWRDSSFTRMAVERGHRVIASPSEWAYLNRPAGELSLAQVHAFDPVPRGLDSAQVQRVLGSEVTFWSEHITSGTNLDLMALPRLLAFADVVWGAAPRDASALPRRIARDHQARLAAMGHVVGPADRTLPRIAITFDSAERQARWQLTDTLAGMTVRATFDGRTPDATSRALAPGEALGTRGMARLQAFVGEGRVLEERLVRMHPHLAVGLRPRITPAPSASYPGTGAFSLTDGLLGSPAHGDGLWMGWWGPDVEVVIDLSAEQSLARVSVNFLQSVRSWILAPAVVGVSWSGDGVSWSPPQLQRHDVPVAREGAFVEPYQFDLPAKTRGRFVKLTARNAGLLPSGHPGAGQPSWLFADEVIVEARGAAGGAR